MQTINSFPAIAGAGKTADLCAQALSNVLEKGAGLPKELLESVSSALTALTAGVQSNMAIGQQAQNMVWFIPPSFLSGWLYIAHIYAIV